MKKKLKTLLRVTLENLYFQKIKKSYQKSIALSNERNTSLKKNVTYNGYGASPKKMESVPKINSKSTQEKKNINYSYQRNRTSQTYSAYSTN